MTGHVNDHKLLALQSLLSISGGNIDDLEQAWLITEASNFDHVNGMWREVFQANGATNENWNSAAYEFLTGLGFSGSITDMWHDYWAAGGGVGDIVDLTQNLITWFTHDETSGTRADSVIGTANDMSDVNTVGYTTGLVGNCSVTATTSERLERSNPTNLHATGRDFMFSGWFYHPGSLQAANIMLGVGTNAIPDYSLVTMGGPNRFRLYTWNGAFDTVDTPSIILSTWNHVVWWYDFLGQTTNIVLNNGVTATTTGVTAIGDQGASSILEMNKANGWGTIPTANDVYRDECGFWDKKPDAAMISVLWNDGNGVGYPG